MSQNVDTKGWTPRNLKLLTKAVQGNEESQYELGLSYMKGDGMPQNLSLAIEWLTKSSDKGFEDAEFLLGSCYENGTGVPRDLPQALTLYVRSANAANKNAQYALGMYYTYESNFDKAMEWFQKAARQQFAPAQFELGRSYYYGLGKIKDTQLGIDYVQKAANRKYEPAVELLPQLN